MDPLTAIILATLLLALLVTLGYAVSCAIWPFTRCGRCHGTGRHRAPLHRTYRPCRRCRSAGYRLRTGRRAYNAWTRIHRELRTHSTNRSS